MISTLTFILFLAVAAVVALFGILGINFDDGRSKFRIPGWFTFAIGAVAFVATVGVMMDQGIDNSRDNCIHNLHGTVVGTSCIVGTDWEEFTSF